MDISLRSLCGLLIIFLVFSTVLNCIIDQTGVFPAGRKVIFDTPQKALLQFFWTFRTLIADILWFKVDYYHHSKGNLEQSDPHADETWFSDLTGGSHHEREFSPPVDLSGMTAEASNKDFDLEKYRNVTMYLPEIIPLLRTITYLNPKFDRAYSLGGYMMVKWMEKKKEGYLFLDEGLKNNPDSEDLLSTYATLLILNEKDYTRPLEYLVRAYSIIRQQEGYLDNDKWPTVLHLLRIAYLKTDQADKALKINKEIDILALHYVKTAEKDSER